MLKRIAIVGPESTGKSVLSEKLATYFKTAWVPEYARQYLDQINRPYEENDLLEIAKGQLKLEDDHAKTAHDFLICDTNLLVVKIWSEVKYGHCHPWIINQIKNRHYYHHLLTSIDLPWEFDPYREHPDMREFLFDKYKFELDQLGCSYTIIKGDYQERLDLAIAALKALK